MTMSRRPLSLSVCVSCVTGEMRSSSASIRIYEITDSRREMVVSISARLIATESVSTMKMMKN